MMPRRKASPTRWILLASVLVLTLTLGSASAAFKYLHEGMIAPEFKGKSLLDDQEVVWNPGSPETPGEVVLIVFWATWSPRSLELLSDLKELSSQYQEHGFRVIAVNVDGQDISATAKQQIRSRTVELDLPFPVLVDQDLKIFYAYGVIAVPSLALVDDAGAIRYGPSGYTYTVRDRIVDSTESLLGIREAPETARVEGYRPDPKASRFYNLGLQMAGQRIYERALDNLDRAVAADSGFSSPLGLKGQIHMSMGEWDLAIHFFEQAAGLDSTVVSTWAGWGRALLAHGEAEEAFAKLTIALGLDEGYTPALLDLAECRILRGEMDAAGELIRAALELNPRDPETLFRAGRYRRLAGNTAGAVAAYKLAMERLVSPSLVAEATGAER